jgi:hypothetical protein
MQAGRRSWPAREGHRRIHAGQHQRSRGGRGAHAAGTAHDYVLSYQTTNTKADNKFRRVNVKVKRSQTTVKAQPGYTMP